MKHENFFMGYLRPAEQNVTKLRPQPPVSARLVKACTILGLNLSFDLSCRMSDAILQVEIYLKTPSNRPRTLKL